MIEFNAFSRQYIGTNSSRRFRRIHNQIPGVLYGKKFFKSSILFLVEHDLIFSLHSKKKFFIEILLLKLDNKDYFVKLKEIQKHAFKPKILHIDFMNVKN